MDETLLTDLHCMISRQARLAEFGGSHVKGTHAMRFPVAIFVLPLLGLCSCALIFDGPGQNVEVKTVSGERDVAGAVCTLENSKGTWQTISPGAVTVHRGYGDLNVRCERGGYVANGGSVPSASKDLWWGNVIFGGLVGAAIDVGVGSAYDYPSPIVVNLQSATVPGAGVAFRRQ
jgi:hypothetical protein